ncbi:hypothetical protein DID88_009398 [Monilinia fructigena]|uniref:Histidine kinase n=1 Tax=Monilinia fructigena TaxID=38457 RepID=A0A395IT02_9HELO|nr:hypothetical protein DID88_009398 [Monilinia fructigena]
MPPPNSPVQKPSFSTSKRNSRLRRSSGDDGLDSRRSSISKDSMPDSPIGAKAPSISSDVEMASNNEVQDVGSSAIQKSENEHIKEPRNSTPGKVLQGNTGPTGTSVKARVSPIHEESISPSLDAAFASPFPSGMETASTESAKTIRGADTPAAIHARTPSYPFPPMRTPRQLSYNGHRPFTALSPTVNPLNFAGGSFYEGPHDQVLSGPITPASGLNFQPAGSQNSRDASNFETPNLYDLSLMLSAEPGLDPWWSTVVKIMRDVYKADRVTLSVPADSTDIENVPWGQKATFNAAEEDELSLTYLPRGSSLIPSSSGDTFETSASEGYASGDSPPAAVMSRPGLTSRHSFTSYEATKRDPIPETARNATARPSPLTRAKSYLSARPDQPPRTATLQNAQLSLQALEDHMNFQSEKPTASWENVEQSNRDVQGRVFSVLQALDYEADPLIDSSGILRVLERERVIALTRDYPYLNDPADEEKSAESIAPTRAPKLDSPERLKKTKAPELGGRVSSLFGSKPGKRSSRKSIHIQGAAVPPLPLPRYEEYEQTPPSPWSQSPAPSPAIRAETTDNPFFANSTVDEETFNPNHTTQDYSKMQQVEAIGLDTAAMESKSAGRGKGIGQLPKYPESSKMQGAEQSREKRTPIAILSILSPVIPYPSNLRHSLEHLSPHMATSFSLCRHFSNLETEVAGLSRKRPHTTGFGAIATGGRTTQGQPAASGNLSYSPADEGLRHQSGGSITSPSDYSGVSRSANASPSGTPILGSQSRPGASRMDTGGSGVAGFRRSSKESSPVEIRSVPRNPADDRASGPSTPFFDAGENTNKGKTDAEGSHTSTNSSGQESRNNISSKEPSNELSEPREPSPSRQIAHDSPRRQAIRGASYSAGKSDRQHTQLHSYGADFGATFQSLPVTSASSMKTSPIPKPSRQGLAVPSDMPPPSDRLKGLMLDSLPAHVFVALPQTGEIVWVNNRYLTYRGQTVSELYQDPWGSIHHEEREDYLKAWSHAVKTGEQFSMQVRIRRFDGTYRWFYTRAVGSRDIRGVIVQWYGSHMDIHDQHIAEVKAARQEEIEASEAKHRQLANLIPQIIFAATEDDGVTFANEQWLSYTGQDFNDALGLGFMDYVHPEDLAKCQIPIGRASTPSTRSKKPAEPIRNPSQTSSGGISGQSSDPSEAPNREDIRFMNLLQQICPNWREPVVIKIATDGNGRLSYTTEVRLRSKTGEYRWHLVRCVEVDNINLGSGDGSWFGACTDINDHKIAGNKAQRSYGIEEQILEQHVSRNQDAVDSLLNIINDILDLSKVDAGMMKLSYEWFHTRSLVEEVNEMVSTMAITKRLELNYIVDVDVPEMVKGDKFRIRQVLLNVIGNAIKFTTVGEVFTRCRVYTDEDAPPLVNEIMLEYSIVDTGRGFTKEEADLIFKPFSQIDGSSTRQHGGSGLGLVYLEATGSTSRWQDAGNCGTCREATRQHIEITLPKDIPYQITPLASVEEAQVLISGDESVNFTHIVLNLGSAEEIVQLIDQLIVSVMLPQTSIVVLSDPVQRQEVIKLASVYDYDQMAKDNRLTFIYKPVKPSRFAVIFDPDKERDLSTDRNRSSAQQQVASQKQHYLDVGQRLGNKGLKILLVEDNLVNQKVLLKFLSKVGIAVELALDGVECTDKVFSKPHGFYSLILCDLHMPRKDGYQTCREIREWEEKGSYAKMPIIALSANVMADVLEKCVQAGFNSYVTKPVDFKELSKAMGTLLDPDPANPLTDPGMLMKAAV